MCKRTNNPFIPSLKFVQIAKDYSLLAAYIAAKYRLTSTDIEHD
ncbi:hypothetical protein VAEKB19_4210116 [Vibrio aestuarianus]|nr:hypothetical protein VAEKB19_4210116 [Vibrio aestuarianus]